MKPEKLGKLYVEAHKKESDLTESAEKTRCENNRVGADARRPLVAHPPDLPTACTSLHRSLPDRLRVERGRGGGERGSLQARERRRSEREHNRLRAGWGGRFDRRLIAAARETAGAASKGRHRPVHGRRRDSEVYPLLLAFSASDAAGKDAGNAACCCCRCCCRRGCSAAAASASAVTDTNGDARGGSLAWRRRRWRQRCADGGGGSGAGGGGRGGRWPQRRRAAS